MIRSFGRPSYGARLLIGLFVLWCVLLAARAALERWTRPEIRITAAGPPA